MQANGNTVEERLSAMGLALPPAPQPAGNYVPAVQWGDLVFTAGQIPVAGGELQFRGKVGQDLTVEDGAAAARLCALNALAAIKGLVGDLERVARVIKVTGFVQSAPGFTEQAKVLNGASELLVAAFGEAGRHARAALGAPELPLGAAVEVDLIVALNS